MKKNIDISEDCKAKLMVVAAKQGLLLKPFLESQLNAMAETGKTFTEVFELNQRLINELQWYETNTLNKL